MTVFFNRRIFIRGQISVQEIRFFLRFFYCYFFRPLVAPLRYQLPRSIDRRAYGHSLFSGEPYPLFVHANGSRAARAPQKWIYKAKSRMRKLI